MFHRRHNTHNNQEDDAVFQEEKINELKAATGPLSGPSLNFCKEPCLRRYLKARNWNVAKAKHMLQESLKWRSTYKPEEIRWNDIAHEGETGKAYRANFKDRDGRTVLVLRPGKQNTKSHDNQLRHLVYLIENAILNLPEDQEQMMWLIDFSGWSLINSVPIKTARETANILQNQYPERLAFAFLYNPPRVFEAFWKVVKLFLDPATFQKVKFIYPKNEESMELMRTFFDVDTLPVEFGGKNNIEYNHEQFSIMMNRDETRSATLTELNEKLTLAAQENSPLEAASEPPFVLTQAS